MQLSSGSSRGKTQICSRRSHPLTFGIIVKLANRSDQMLGSVRPLNGLSQITLYTQEGGKCCEREGYQVDQEGSRHIKNLKGVESWRAPEWKTLRKGFIKQPNQLPFASCKGGYHCTWKRIERDSTQSNKHMLVNGEQENEQQLDIWKTTTDPTPLLNGDSIARFVAEGLRTGAYWNSLHLLLLLDTLTE